MEWLPSNQISTWENQPTDCRTSTEVCMLIWCTCAEHWPLSAGSILLVEVFEYRLEHTSQSMLVEDRMKEAQIFSEVCMYVL